MRIGLRICVNSTQGALQGVPNLLRLFDTYKLRASFFFALGPDRCGRLATAHRLQPWCSRRNLLPRLSATLLPSRGMEKRVAAQMRAVEAAGHEIGLLSFDPVNWVGKAAYADEAWTRESLVRSIEAFERIIGRPPRCHAAAGWQVNGHLLGLEVAFGFDYASDVMGRSVFLPQLQVIDSDCPQIPTTLPILTELLGRGAEVTPENVHEYLYADSQYIVPHGHVYALDAEMEGVEYLPLMEKLVVMWKGYGEGLTTLGAIREAVETAALKRHQIGWSREPGLDVYTARQALPV